MEVKEVLDVSATNQMVEHSYAWRRLDPSEQQQILERSHELRRMNPESLSIDTNGLIWY